MCVERGCGDKFSFKSFSVCVSECVMGSPYSPDLYSTSLKRYDLCNKQKRNQKTHLWNKQINRQIKKKVLQKAGVQTQVFKNLPRRSYQNIKIISQFVHIVTLNKISLVQSFLPPKTHNTPSLHSLPVISRGCS